jgi:hypothetical protein
VSDEPTTILELKNPIQFGKDELIAELRFRPVTGKDLEDFPITGATMGDYQRIAARLTGHPTSAIKMATGPDIFAIAGAVESQLAGGPPTGAT